MRNGNEEMRSGNEEMRNGNEIEPGKARAREGTTEVGTRK